MTETPDIVHDPWTPDQESQLLKALVRYKPIGLHAHFRMLSIRNFLLSSGTISSDVTHTRIPGIWTKIRTLYDVDGLDEREDGIFTSLRDGAGGTGDGEEGSNGKDEAKSETKADERGNEDDNNNDEEEVVKAPRGRGRPKGQGKNKNAASTSAATAAAVATSTTATTEGTKDPAKAKKGYWRDFELPRGDQDGDFEALMWDRRLNPDGTPDGSDWDTRSHQSHARFATRGQTGNDSTAAGETTDEPRSSPVPTASTRRGTRSGRKGRVDRLKDEMEIDTPTSGRSSRRASKAASEVDEEMEDADDDDEGDEDDEESETAEEEEEEKRGTTSKRGRGGRRGRGKRGRRRG